MNETRGDPPPAGVRCARLKLERFSTDADVDLRGLSLAPKPAGAGAGAPTGRAGTFERILQRPRRWWDRIRDDLMLGEDLDATRRAEGGGAVRSLNARHCRVGGVFRLPGGEGALDCADLAFASADRIEIPGRCLRGGCAALSLDLNSVRADSARLIEPLPARVDARDAAVGHWDIGADRAATGDDRRNDREDKYLKFAQQSWPFAQTVYTRLEQDYRDAGKHREADRFQAAMGWRLWRWSFIRPMLETEGWRMQVSLMVLLALVAAWPLSATWLEWLMWGYGVLLLAGTVFALLSFLNPLKRASRFLLGVLVVAPAQLVFGFGIRWWLPLLTSAIVFVVWTLPMLSDCRNLAATDGKGNTTVAPAASADRADAKSLFAVMGAGVDLPPRVVVRCSIPVPGGNEARNWDLGEAFWLALRYHVPVIGLDGFFHGEREEAVRPSAGAMFYDMLGQLGSTSWTTPLGYTRTVYLLSWILIPFSLIFLGARIQRRYRLQK